MQKRSMSLSLLSVLAVSAAFFAAPAAAQVNVPGVQVAQADMGADFGKLDANKDGAIDKTEAAVLPGLSSVFAKADTNRDGKLDQTEFQAAMAMMK
jgi:EF hand